MTLWSQQTVHFYIMCETIGSAKPTNQDLNGQTDLLTIQ